MKLTQLRDAAIDAAHAAGRVLAMSQGRKFDIREKKGAGLVTNVDLSAEKAALKVLKKRFPDFGFLTEESPAEISDSPGRWILDPLDGTTNFIHGFPMYCVSIAAEWEGELVVGVIYHPVLKETYVGVRGKGATINGRKMTVSKTRKLTEALLTTGFAYTTGGELHRDITSFERLSNVARAIRRPGSAALDLAYTARGIFDGFWERNLNAWDVAAGALLIREAGGKVTDYKGNEFTTASREIVVGNPHLHSQILQTIAPEFCPI
jgi:myo-inositol-1(or 4)-monophosphatase